MFKLKINTKLERNTREANIKLTALFTKNDDANKYQENLNALFFLALTA